MPSEKFYRFHGHDVNYRMRHLAVKRVEQFSEIYERLRARHYYGRGHVPPPGYYDENGVFLRQGEGCADLARMRWYAADVLVCEVWYRGGEMNQLYNDIVTAWWKSRPTGFGDAFIDMDKPDQVINVLEHVFNEIPAFNRPSPGCC